MPALLSLPKLPPLNAEVRRLRGEGVYVHYIHFDASATENERRACVARLARLPSNRARGWYWRACAVADWYEGKREMDEQELRHDLDRAGEFPRWSDFERETIQQPLTQLYDHADFLVGYQVQRRRSMIVSVHFELAAAQAG